MNDLPIIIGITLLFTFCLAANIMCFYSWVKYWVEDSIDAVVDMLPVAIVCGIMEKIFESLGKNKE